MQRTYAGIALLAALEFCGLPAVGQPAPPRAGSLADAVQSGHTLFTSASFGGNGTCETCHSNGGHGAGKLPSGEVIPGLEGAAAHYPRYAAKSHEIVTLGGQVARCIAGAMGGKPPLAGSADAVFLETYVASLSAGAVMGKQFEAASRK